MFITPPYAPAAYVAAAVAGANPMRVGYQAMKLAIVAYLVPFITIFHPALLWIGTWDEVALAAICALVAIYALSVAFEGYSLTHLTWPERVLWFVGGLLLFYSKITFIIPGSLLILLGLAIQVMRRKKKQSADNKHI